MKLCVITCYKHPDYVRAITLRAAVAKLGYELIVVKNQRTGLLRYAEVFCRVLWVRLTLRPDAYLLTFRGYEMLLPVRLLTIGRALIYDEFINPIEWASYEHKKISPRNPLTHFFTWSYRQLLRTVRLVLTDTESHADLSAELTGIDRNKIFALPVGTDESTFSASVPEFVENEIFTVFYYGSMLPLHGLKYVIDAAVKLNHEPVKFVLVGGSSKTAHDVALAVGNGAKIEYHAWVEYDRLPALMHAADLCLAGPFGDTFQAQYVITGKAYQYMALGRPMVVGENKESGIFKPKLEALIVPQADADALADVIKWGLRNRNRLYAMGKKAQLVYERNFSTGPLADRLQEGLRGAGLPEPRAAAKGK